MFSSLPSVSLCTLSSSSIEQRQSSYNSSKPISESLKTQIFHKFKTPFELKQVHTLFIKNGIPLSDLQMSNVASVCALTPSFQYAQQIFQQVEKQETFLWNCCLKDFAESDSPYDALLLFHQMQMHNVCLDSFTCSFVLKACVRLHDLFHGRILHGYVEKLGLRSNLVLLNVIVHLYASCGKISDALLLFDKMPQRDVVTWNTMITQLVKSGDTDSAYKLFVEMPVRNLRSWTAMISGFVQSGKPKEAIALFEKMEEEKRLKPNEVTLVAILAACADLGALELGIRIHRYSDKCGFTRNNHISNTLIDMYIKCGCLEAAIDVFKNTDERTIFTWSTMIQGLAIHGKANEALKLFSEMIQTGTKPNGVTFVGILNACSHMGLINEGRSFFASMTRDYKIIPSIEHYGCMVDLLSRGGLLDEARDFIERMPIEPNAAVWGALLGGCKVHKNIEIAEISTRHLQELDPLNDGYYVVLANIYAEAKRYEDAAKMRKMMKDRGVKRTFGFSSVTVKGTVHEFVAGDEYHPRSEEIFKMWDHLLVRMRSKGYVPNVSVVALDVEEKEKERILFRHSEKLALVFGLMNTEPGETIRIFKNMRICEDCHASFKVISSIVNREIVVRDRNRFHYFKDGSCSCRDYW
ncbi:hypothetical protein CASFOL_028022 [Castilleja foliolosa]|uniref:DYW domain-containing protein n=1 Tax=Castilleja foliolosa TaxID=1961234 RepID=A0ABD3CJ52_9LAMI